MHRLFRTVVLALGWAAGTLAAQPLLTPAQVQALKADTAALKGTVATTAERIESRQQFLDALLTGKAYTSATDYSGFIAWAYADTPLYQQLVAVREGSMPSGHPFLFHAMAKVTETYRFLGAYANAEEICRKNLKLMETYYAKGHPQTAERLRELSKLCVLQGKNEEGKQYLDKATALLALQ